MKKIPRLHIWILIANIIYLLGFTIYYILKQNYEFMIYIGVLAVFIVIICFLHVKYRFTTGTLIGISIWGFLHMLGGSLYILGTRLYDFQLIPVVLRFDQLMHFYSFLFLTLIAFQVLRPYLTKKVSWFMISILLVFIGMGIGALNEIIELIAVLAFNDTGVGGYFNTAFDLVFNTIGAIFAVILINIKRKRENAKK